MKNSMILIACFVTTAAAQTTVRSAMQSIWTIPTLSPDEIMAGVGDSGTGSHLPSQMNRHVSISRHPTQPFVFRYDPYNP